MKTVLVVLALLCAVFASLLGFELVTMDEPRVLGWIALSLAFGFGAVLAPE
jgi:hypothetical protein